MGAIPDDAILWELARALGLDPGPVAIRRVPAVALDTLAAYLLPGRMHHWSLGRRYEHIRRSGVRIHEVVVPGCPATVYLWAANAPVLDLVVRCHALAHADFIRHNAYFAGVPQDLTERVTDQAARVRRYAARYGQEAVEAVLDAALALALGAGATAPVLGQATSDDLLGLIAARAPGLQPWQRDLVAMVRAETVPLAAQLRTAVANEGWATFWHRRMVRALELDGEASVEFARVHAMVTGCQPGDLNPYALGEALFEAVVARGGTAAAFRARQAEDDVSLVRNHCDLAVAVRLGGPEAGTAEAFGAWRDALLRRVGWNRLPQIAVESVNHRGRGELYLCHRYDGRELDLDAAVGALALVARLWGRPVHLQTVSAGRSRLLSHDGRSPVEAVLPPGGGERPWSCGKP
ncbi:MAG: SpoVR family protein [Firmicutes bacterium]|nr:SpoVR family protein [Alicyclobacillaceae bacterium]MCL6496837.1 SpoVR family protein [Bacillota bacterium]